MSSYKNPAIQLSPNELNVIHNRDFLLTKIEVSKKIELLLGLVERELHTAISKYRWPRSILVKSGKISRGAYYQGLPYHILDYPRRFEKENVFAFRTLFWWGNFFSATLHLSGSYLEQNRSALIESLPIIQATPAYLCVNSTPWEHHFEPDNYLPVAEIKQQELYNLMLNHPFVKLSYRWDLEAYQTLPQRVTEAFHQLLGWLQVPE